MGNNNNNSRNTKDYILHVEGARAETKKSTK
jgi:hypothetical protein